MQPPKPHTTVHTSDGKSRPNVEPRAAPPLPPAYYNVGEGARVGILNMYATMLNAQLDYWAGTTPHTLVVDLSGAYSHNNACGNINRIIATMNAACTEHSILTTAGQRMLPYISLGYNGFVPAIKAIRAQLTAMQTALP